MTGPGTATALTEIVEGTIRVAARGYLRRVFAFGGLWFVEVEPDGAGVFIAPLRATVIEATGMPLSPKISGGST